MVLRDASGMLTMDHRRCKTAADNIIGTIPFVYSLVSRTYTISKFETQPNKVVGS